MTRACPLLFAILSLGACADSTASNPARSTYAGTLSVDIRGAIALSMAQANDVDLDVSISAKDGNGYGLFDPTKPLTTKGRLEPFPEAPGWQMYTARFDVAPVGGGPCGAEPVSLAMSLVRRDGNARVAGSITGYCGAGKFSGVPARVLRVAGDAPKI